MTSPEEIEKLLKDFGGKWLKNSSPEDKNIPVIPSVPLEQDAIDLDLELFEPQNVAYVPPNEVQITSTLGTILGFRMFVFVKQDKIRDPFEAVDMWLASFRCNRRVSKNLERKYWQETIKFDPGQVIKVFASSGIGRSDAEYFEVGFGSHKVIMHPDTAGLYVEGLMRKIEPSEYEQYGIFDARRSRSDFKLVSTG